jgi:Rrf2 family protein
MQLSQSATYALQALLQLAEAGEGVLLTRGKLAAKDQLPQRFLVEILHGLVKHGMLRSTRGGGGGYALARRPEEITLLDVIEAVDGPLPAGLPVGNTMSQPLSDWLRANLEQVAPRHSRPPGRHHLEAPGGSRSQADRGEPESLAAICAQHVRRGGSRQPLAVAVAAAKLALMFGSITATMQSEHG